MKVTKVEVVRSKEPIQLPEPWLAAWNSPDGTPITSMGFSFYKVYTDEGVIGIGPDTGCHNPSMIVGLDPFMVGDFWDKRMSGRRAGHSGYGASGLEIALWDVMGKATGQPVYKLLGACRDKIFVYAATSRLLTIDQHVRQVQGAMETGFKAVKIRLHRQNVQDDIDVVEAVRNAVGDKMMILVDANQNNPSNEYKFWSRQTALKSPNVSINSVYIILRSLFREMTLMDLRRSPHPLICLSQAGSMPPRSMTLKSIYSNGLMT